MTENRLGRVFLGAEEARDRDAAVGQGAVWAHWSGHRPRPASPRTLPSLSWPLSCRDLQVHGLMLPLILPSFYSELFTLYLLLHEREDSLYSQGIANLSLFPDTKLLEFLDVQK